MRAKTLMVQGSASSVGKSLVVTALCRIFARKGISVAPYKSQNMSNNAYALLPRPEFCGACDAKLPSAKRAESALGAEIGRAQALQAVAANVEPSVDMNPILLKPEGDNRSQVVVMGRPWKRLDAREYYANRDELWAIATGALDRLRDSRELVIIEGAGSPAEINLREHDIVNMSIALYAKAPVILVVDIDVGGAFAQILGTLELLSEEERELVKGIVINKFRGDLSLLDSGIAAIEARVSVPVLGVIPWLKLSALADEDGASLERVTDANTGMASETSASGRDIDIAVLRLPRISNFDDFDALALEAGVRVRFVSEPAELGLPDAFIVPGTKATIDDLEWIREKGFDEAIRWLPRTGRSVVGICGGFQILGLSLSDPEGIEREADRGRLSTDKDCPVQGLGLLPIRTVFSPEKRSLPRRAIVRGGPGFFAHCAGVRVEGYEIHCGVSKIDGEGIFTLESQEGLAGEIDGAASYGGLAWGSYLHGIFDLPEFRRAWLTSLGWSASESGATSSNRGVTLSDAREAAIEALADEVESALDMESIEGIIGLGNKGADK